MYRQCARLVALAATGMVFLSILQSASADEVVFKNGDKLSGKITSFSDGKLIIKTDAAGDVKVNAADIQTFSTDAPIVVKLADGTMINQKIDANENGQVLIDGGLLNNQKVNVTDITAVNPPPAQWTGDIKFGGIILRGNTSSESVNFGLNVQRKTDKDVISFDASYLYGRTKDRTTGVSTAVSDNWQAHAKYEYNFTRRFYGYGEAGVARDRLAFLDLRFNPSAGVGYRWSTKPNFTFDTEGGLAWIDEHYTNGTPTKDDISLKLAYHLNYKFNDTVSLFHNLTYYPSLESINNYLVTTDLGLRAGISTHFFTEFKFLLDYDSTPANGALKTNTRYELSIGYSI